MILFIILFLILYIGINYLLEKRLYLSIARFHIQKRGFQIVFWFLALSYVFYQLLHAYLPKLIRVPLAYIGSYYLGFLFYCLLFFTVCYLIHRFIKVKWDLYLLALILIIGVIFPVGIYQQHHILTKEYRVASDKVEQDYTIALVTDLHLGDLIGTSRLNKMIDTINAAEPDLILIAGDLIDSDYGPVKEGNMLLPLTRLESRLGVYMTMGNHDFYTGEIPEVKEELTRLGIHVLEDESVILENQLVITGRDDASFNEKELRSFIDSAQLEKFNIVMDHNPARVRESVDLNIDMQVSGHTHNGQLYPLNYVIDVLFEVGYGHRKIEQTDVFVSGGIGGWGPQLRTSSNAEFTLIHVESEH
ncbi:metallophosphoesterase [Beduini massiliensis]|uniref:metallophosphoesterase n=1 Tax=Beduini massiliensis TaxID=1585974 RepID=UPI00059AAF4B|nr:metallophosphoesterase [Beduini massiliensis]